MRRALIALGALAAAFGLWLCADLFLLARDLRGGSNKLDTLQPTLLDEPGGLAKRTGDARDRLEDADRRARRSVPLRAVSLVPGLAPQVATVRDLTGRAVEVADILDDAARPIQTEIDKGMGGAPRRMAVIGTLTASFDDASRRLTAVPPPPKRRYVHPLVDLARRETSTDLRDAQRDVARLAPQLTALRDLFVGPTRYLVLAGNNAEMRAAAMVLQVGVAEISQGEVRLIKFRSSARMYVHNRPDIPDELHDLYGWMQIGNEWRAGTASPDFPTIGALYAEMAARKKALGAVQGTLFIDVSTLRLLLSVIGPVEVDGKTYTANNVADEILYRHYLEFGKAQHTVQNERRDLQGKIGQAVFAAFTQRQLPLGKLVRVLDTLVESRHLMVWSASENLQRLWSDLGADGALRSDGFMVCFDNISANKLDYHLLPTVRLETVSVKDGRRRVRATITVTNKPRDPTSPYIEGLKYGREYDIPPGAHRFYVKYYLPDQATDVTSNGPKFEQRGRDGPMRVVTYKWLLNADSTESRSMEFTLPADFDPVLIPAGRFWPTRYEVEGRKAPIFDVKQTELRL